MGGLGQGYVGHDHVVGGDAVRRDEEEGLVVDLVQVADLAARDERQHALQVGVGDCNGVGHGGGMQLEKWGECEVGWRRGKTSKIAA